MAVERIRRFAAITCATGMRHAAWSRNPSGRIESVGAGNGSELTAFKKWRKPKSYSGNPDFALVAGKVPRIAGFQAQPLQILPGTELLYRSWGFRQKIVDTEPRDRQNWSTRRSLSPRCT